jgi:hypothetical protein
MQWPRVSIRHLMVAIACLALLFPTGLGAMMLAITIFSPYYLIPCLIIIAVDTHGGPRTSFAVFSIWIGLGCWLCWRTSVPMRLGPELPIWLILVFTPIHLVGPIYLARQYWREKPIGSGEILWTWSGLAWLNLITAPISSHYNPTLNDLVAFARVLSALVVWFAILGKRPKPPEPTWTYYLGWGLVEYDAIVWGWYAVPWLLSR